jgi:hypothetical protein
MEQILQSIIPTTMMVWTFFYILPFILCVLGQFFLCFKAVKTVLKLIPVLCAALLAILIALCVTTGFLGFLIGGFVSLLLIPTIVLMLVGSFIGWLIARLIRKK